MMTAGMKRKAKTARGGQNRRENAPRYDNGRIDYGRMAREDAAIKTTLRHRMKLPGVTKENASSPEAGTIVGRMFLMGEITDRQLNATREYERRRSAYLAAIAAPRRPRSGSDLGFLHERLSSEDASSAMAARVFMSDEDYAEWADTAKARYSEIRSIIMEVDPFGMMAMESIVVEDKMVESLVGSLRVACNRIVDRLKILGGREHDEKNKRRAIDIPARSLT